MPPNHYFGHLPPSVRDIQMSNQKLHESINTNSNGNVYNGISASPTFPNPLFNDSGSSTSSTLLLLGGFLLNSNSSSGLNFLYHNPRVRYYLLKSFDLEDDLEFCPEIPEHYDINNTIKKFNPYTATVFLPKEAYGNVPGSPVVPSLLPRPRTPRIKKAIEIVNPHTKSKIGSSAK